jgi:hypothetical protein
MQTAQFRVETELYNGWFPSLWNYTDYTGLAKQIDTDIQFNTFARNCSLAQCHFLTTWSTTYDLDLIDDWTYQYHFYNLMQFHNTILYRYYYVASNEWGVATVSTLCFLSIMEHPFPQTATLALYSTIDGLGEDTNQFQYYMGDSEEISCVDFHTYYGNWSKLYSSNLSAQFIDNYLQFNTTNNGLKTTFEDMAVIDTLDYNVLLFECQVFNPMWVVAIFNPSLHMSDNYYYQFNASNVGNWYSVIIPFFNFTNYWSYSTDLGELGFWISSGRINIANIRVAHYYDMHGNTITYSNQTITVTNGYYQAFNYDNKYQYGTFPNTRILDSVFWTMQTNKAAIPPYPFTFSYFEMNLSDIFADFLAFTFVGEASIPTSGSTGNISIFNWVSGLYDLLWSGIANTIVTRYKVLANAMDYVNATGFCKVKGFSGYGFSGGAWQSNFACDYFSITTVTLPINVTYYTADSYRLISPINAANPDALVFNQPTETLAILDFFNNTIWRGEITYAGWSPNVYIPIGLPMTTLYCINYENYSVVVDVQRGLGVYLQLVVPPNSMIPVRIFSTSYLVTIRNLEMILLNITSVSCNHSKTVTVIIGKPQSFDIPPAFDPFLVYLLIIVAIIAIIAIIPVNFWQFSRFRKKTEKMGLKFEGVEYG